MLDIPNNSPHCLYRLRPFHDKTSKSANASSNMDAVSLMQLSSSKQSQFRCWFHKVELYFYEVAKP